MAHFAGEFYLRLWKEILWANCLEFCTSACSWLRIYIVRSCVRYTSALYDCDVRRPGPHPALVRHVHGGDGVLRHGQQRGDSTSTARGCQRRERWRQTSGSDVTRIPTLQVRIAWFLVHAKGRIVCFFFRLLLVLVSRVVTFVFVSLMHWPAAQSDLE